MAPVSSVSEAMREEETLRYAAALLSESVIQDSPDPLPRSICSTASDAALVAFAQLAVLRLNADRAVISLFDSKRQHIVAAATPSTAIEGCDDDDNRHESLSSLGHDTQDLLCRGHAIPRAHGVCEHVLHLPSAQYDGQPVLPISMVRDLTQDEQFCTRPYTRPGSTWRFYAGVPIRTPQDIDIGVFCILASEPRPNLMHRQQRLLRHLSALVMSHLSAGASAESYRRNERMVRGLGSLVEGSASMSKWRGALNTTSFADVRGREGALNVQQQHIQRFGGAELTYKGPTHAMETEGPGPDVDHAQELELTSTHASASPNALSDDDQQKGKSSFTTHPEHQVEEDMVVVRLLFSRAANIIRESIEVEGALFLDASIGSYGGLVRRAPTNVDDRDRHLSTSSSSENDTNTADDDTASPSFCGIVGFSHSHASSINGDDPVPEHASVPETFLARLLRRYPEGQIFNFSEDGSIRWGFSDSESVDSGEEAPPVQTTSPISESLPDRKKEATTFYRHPRPRRGEGALLQKMFPGARSVAVYPLWDSHKEKWHAGGFVWTRARSRIFTVSGELSYLRAFGSTVMAEVARIDVLRADKAKEDVLGSLSHEIRSPLHGVILGLELMHDTTLDSFQEDVLHTVETCGRTLLDTMDHLLDFSKVNHFLRPSKRKLSNSRARGLRQDPGTRNSIEAGMMSLFSDVSLDALLEEVVESVYAGFSFQQTSSDWASRRRTSATTNRGQAGTLRRLESVRQMDNSPAFDSQRPEAGVAIYLSIDPTVSWNFFAQPGALRRIMMNIFGNALKYTKRGTIVVSLTQESSSLKKKKSRLRNVIFSISDSGRGINSDFLQNRLFTPFTQENQLSSGSGLGLSIVKQIVHGLGGRIGVESKVGYGTTVRVSIPLRLCSPYTSPTGLSTHRDKSFSEHLKLLNGVKVSLVGFAANFDPDKPLLADNTDARLCPRLFMETLCRCYLNLDVQAEPEDTVTDPLASILVCTQDALGRILGLNYLAPVRPVVVICNSILDAHELTSRSSSAPFPIYIPQPAGPRKLARTLIKALDRWEVANVASPSGDNSQPMQPSNSENVPGTYFSDLAMNLSAVHGPPYSDHEDTPKPRALPVKTSDRPREEIPVSDRPQPSVLQSNMSPSLEGCHSNSPQASVEDAATFLLVDDNAVNLKILASYAKKLGRNHDKATNGLEALEACRSRSTHYKCIFMDISMPVMDGLEATRHIRAYEKQNGWEPALVIALTGLGSAKKQQEAFASGIDLFLTKPVPLKELGHILDERGV